MESLVKFLEDKITDKMSVEEIVDVFEQMCSTDRKSTRLNSSHYQQSRMPSSA